MQSITLVKKDWKGDISQNITQLEQEDLNDMQLTQSSSTTQQITLNTGVIKSDK